MDKSFNSVPRAEQWVGGNWEQAIAKDPEQRSMGWGLSSGQP